MCQANILPPELRSQPPESFFKTVGFLCMAVLSVNHVHVVPKETRRGHRELDTYGRELPCG